MCPVFSLNLVWTPFPNILYFNLEVEIQRNLREFDTEVIESQR